MRTVDPRKLPRILQAASTLFASRPFSEVRMADVAAKAKVAKGTLYLHFADKESLFRAMVAEMTGRLLMDAESRFAKLNSVEQKLRLLIQSSVAFSARYPRYLVTLHDLDSGIAATVDANLQQKRVQLFDVLVSLLNEAHRNGEFLVPHPERAALSLLGMLHRVMQGTSLPWPDDLADWIADQFLFGIQATIPAPEGTR